MSVSHHSSEEFILILRVSNSSVCVCALLFSSPRIAASCCSRSWLGGAGLHRGDLYPLVCLVAGWLAERGPG